MSDLFSKDEIRTVIRMSDFTPPPSVVLIFTPQDNIVFNDVGCAGCLDGWCQCAKDPDVT